MKPGDRVRMRRNDHYNRAKADEVAGSLSLPEGSEVFGTVVESPDPDNALARTLVWVEFYDEHGGGFLGGFVEGRLEVVDDD